MKNKNQPVGILQTHDGSTRAYVEIIGVDGEIKFYFVYNQTQGGAIVIVGPNTIEVTRGNK